MISLNIEKTFGFISKEKVSAYDAEVKAAQEMLEKGTGKGCKRHREYGSDSHWNRNCTDDFV